MTSVPAAQHYAGKGRAYFQGVREEILPLISHSNGRVLDVGCGEGATLAWLKGIHPCTETVGIEFVDRAAAVARNVADHIVCADIERDPVEFPSDYFDLILCLDVLEHLQDPWATLRRLVNWLAPTGKIIVSVPNVRYRGVLVDLVLRGKFEYQDFGILDKTHLRFFTRASCRSLLESADLSVIHVMTNPARIGGKAAVFNALSLGYFRDIFVWQYLMVATKKDGDRSSP